MKINNILGIDFCNFETGYSGPCGMHTPDKSGVCERHKGRTAKPKRIKGTDFSGDSKWRQNMGMYQAKEKI